MMLEPNDAMILIADDHLDKITIARQMGVAMDDVMPHFAPNLIKFDVEGSEEQALRGAEQLLRIYKPALAVSVYHIATDLWRIPLYLASIYGKDCKYYLRRHSRTIADTVLYVHPTK